MLDNWTEEEFFSCLERYGIQYESGAYEIFATTSRRIAIVDNPELESAWDRFVQAYWELETIRKKRQNEPA